MIASTPKHYGHEHPCPRSAAVVDGIVAQLSDRGYQDTEPRRRVISAVADQGRPFTAGKPCASPPGVGISTVYQRFRPLVETARVCRVLTEDHELRYQLSQPGGRHHLLCGVSVDRGRCDVEDMLREAAAAAGFETSGHSREAYGQWSAAPSADRRRVLFLSPIY